MSRGAAEPKRSTACLAPFPQLFFGVGIYKLLRNGISSEGRQGEFLWGGLGAGFWILCFMFLHTYATIPRDI
jgi:hypothetical protein